MKELRKELLEHVDLWVEQDKQDEFIPDPFSESDMQEIKEHFTMVFDNLTNEELNKCCKLYLQKRELQVPNYYR